MKIRPKLFTTFGLLFISTVPFAPLRASDHADTAENYNRPGADLSDVFIFPSPTNNDNVVLVLDVHPLIPASQGASTSFDPNVLYHFKIDTTGDYVEDLVIQVRFAGVGVNQRAVVAGPYRPFTRGTTAVFGRPYRTTGLINTTFSPTPGMTVFTGGRSDPFFFDLERFFAILPDRMTPATGLSGRGVSSGQEPPASPKAEAPPISTERTPYDPERARKTVAFWQAQSDRDAQGAIALRELAAAYLSLQRETGDIADAVRAEDAARRSLKILSRGNAGAATRLARALLAQHRFPEALAIEAGPTRSWPVPECSTLTS